MLGNRSRNASDNPEGLAPPFERAVDGPDDVDVARGAEYALLATLLLRPPDTALLNTVAGIAGDSTPLGAAHSALADAADGADPDTLGQEYFRLFEGVGRSELLPYGSYYLTGFLNERPLARLREDLRHLGIARAAGQLGPEDHAGLLCEMMAGFASGAFAASQDAQAQFFERHLAPWVGRFFLDLERTAENDFYRRLGTVGRLFMDIEVEAFSLPE
jgi:TorA maturation chaperone TorD